MYMCDGYARVRRASLPLFGAARAPSFWRLCVTSLSAFFAGIAAIGRLGDFGPVSHLLKSVCPPQSSLFLAPSDIASVLLAARPLSRKLVFLADAYAAVLEGVLPRRRVPDSIFLVAKASACRTCLTKSAGYVYEQRSSENCISAAHSGRLGHVARVTAASASAPQQTRQLKCAVASCSR